MSKGNAKNLDDESLHDIHPFTWTRKTEKFQRGRSRGGENTKQDLHVESLHNTNMSKMAIGQKERNYNVLNTGVGKRNILTTKAKRKTPPPPNVVAIPAENTRMKIIKTSTWAM